MSGNGAIVGEIVLETGKNGQKRRLLGKVAENGAFCGEKLLKMGQNAPKKGHFLGKNAEMTRKGSKGGIYWGK